MHKYFVLLSFGVLMSSCCRQEPKIFGVDQNVWGTLSAEERRVVIDGYNRREAIKESNRVTSEAVKAAKDVLSDLSEK